MWCGLADTPPNPRPVAATSWLDFADGGDSWCAIDGAAGLSCWGAGNAGQLGTGDAWRTEPSLTLP